MRPREQFAHEGPSDLGDAELVALLLGTGTSRRSALQIAAGLLDRFDGLTGLARAQTAELQIEPGVGLARAVRLHAALELGKRSIRGARALPQPVRTSRDAWERLGPALQGLPDEELHALYLDRRRRPIAQRRLTRGTDGFTVVDPRQVFRPAVGIGATGVILAHNHPSGDPTPSAQDRDVTARVASAGRIIGVALLDHLVVGARGYSSLAEQGALPQWNEGPAWTAD